MMPCTSTLGTEKVPELKKEHRDKVHRKMPETSPFGPQDTQDSGWKLCPGPVGQQVENIGGIDEEEGIDKNPQMDGTVFVMIF